MSGWSAAAHWDRLAAGYERAAAGWPLGPLRRRAVALLEPHPGETILLAGCGPAHEAQSLPRGVRAVGCDLAGAMLRRARPRLARLARADAQRLAFADGAFDAVLLCFICAVAPDGAAVLAEALRVTRPGGRVVLLDKLRRGPDHLLWRLFGRALRWTGSDFDRGYDVVTAGARGARLTLEEPRMLGGYISILRYEKPR